MHRHSDVGDEQIYLDAAEWIVRADDNGLSSEEECAFSEWRKADGRHERALRELRAVWDDIPELEHIGDLYPLAANDDELDASRGGRLSWLHRVAGALAGIAAIAAAVAFVLPMGSEPEFERIETRVAQVSKAGLADGSVATLGPETAIEVMFTPKERRLHMRSGEAFFEVAKSAVRPFIVDADGSFIKVVGTSFNVDRQSGLLEVAVLHGTVEVYGKGREGGSILLGTLTRGKKAQIVTGPDGTARLAMIPSDGNIANFAALAAGWRDGRLSYEDARLDEILADINRYYAPGISIADPKLGDVRVTASFKATGIRQFVKSIDQLFPIVAEEAMDGSFVLRPAD
ncbi:MAG: FecR domain-containing protein [Novosphingobium sp.]|nr:FecR domain-containing protein [Novosphingobium sp.]